MGGSSLLISTSIIVATTVVRRNIECCSCSYERYAGRHVKAVELHVPYMPRYNGNMIEKYI
jgi:hypothetical protein